MKWRIQAHFSLILGAASVDSIYWCIALWWFKATCWGFSVSRGLGHFIWNHEPGELDETFGQRSTNLFQNSNFLVSILDHKLSCCSTMSHLYWVLEHCSIQECLLMYLINLCVSVQPSNKCGGITIHTVLSDSSHFCSCDYGTLPNSVVIKWGSLRLLVPKSLLQYCHQRKPIFTNAFGK